MELEDVFVCRSNQSLIVGETTRCFRGVAKSCHTNTIYHFQKNKLLLNIAAKRKQTVDQTSLTFLVELPGLMAMMMMMIMLMLSRQVGIAAALWRARHGDHVWCGHTKFKLTQPEQLGVTTRHVG